MTTLRPRPRHRLVKHRRYPLGRPEPVAFAQSIPIPMPAKPVVGVLEPRTPVTLSSGSFSLAGWFEDGSDWASPAWRPPAHSSGSTGKTNESERVPQRIPLAQVLALLMQPPLWLCVSADGPLQWPAEILDFQKTGVAVLVERKSVLLADDMGLGKTIQAAAAMRLLVRRHEIERILVAAPAAVLRNWREELSRWAPELRVIEVTGTQAQRVWKWDARVHVKIVSYETLRSDAARVIRRHGKWDVVCLDEAQRIKNSGSDISGVVKSIESDRRWALTGTPLENSLEDVRSVLAFLRPSGPGEAHKADPDGADIRRALSHVQLRRRKLEVLADLPAKTTSETFLPLGRRQREEYDALLGRGVEELRRMGSAAGSRTCSR